MMPQPKPFSLNSTIASLIREGSAQLSGRDARREIELLLEHVLEVDRAWLFSYPEHPVVSEALERFTALLARRIAGEPIAYLLGHVGFWTLDLQVTAATLVPRPETELLVEVALEYLPLTTALRVVDLGTGSGAIALALASERPGAVVTATDASADALAVASGNARRNALTNVFFREGSWFEPLRGERFHLIASNPPYVAENDPHLGQGDLRYEPALALSCGIDGLSAIRHIARHAPLHLEVGGWLLMEHGFDQGEAVRGVMREAGFEDVATRHDLEGRDRVTLGKRSS